jgi:2-methylcitrate dehydratase
MLTEDILSKEERDRFIGLCERLEDLTAEEVQQLNPQIDLSKMIHTERDTRGIF